MGRDLWKIRFAAAMAWAICGKGRSRWGRRSGSKPKPEKVPGSCWICPLRIIQKSIYDMIGILIFEDNNDLRESLVNLITFSKDLLLLGAYPRAVEAARQVGELKPDVILMDIDMPGLNGIQAVREIRLVDKKAQIIMITIFDDSRNVLDAICAGANGYLPK